MIKQLIIIFGIFFFVVFTACKKEQKAAIEYGALTDIDGNVYKTVKIGNQWWMTENLKVKRYRNGDSLKFVNQVNNNLDSLIWNHLDIGAYCIICNSNSTSQNYQGKMFGFLYNYYTISDSRNIAPTGWHIPTDDEWKELEIKLGMSNEDANKINWRGDVQGNKLKIQNGWKDPFPSSNKWKVWGTNESGFAAIGGSCCMYNGIWGNPGTFSTGFWWTSSLNNNYQAWYRYIDYNKANVFRYYGPLTYGFSIRCVKD